jgi:16S rRNA G1207 methylase RsmC
VIVEFGAGGGHFGLVLAYYLPQCTVVLMDRKIMSLARLQCADISFFIIAHY